ncbi:MAG: ParB/RepB/Spo0J family partition protein [Methylophilaceae bacterium]|jgi:ParB family chromosome partitioning protein
MVKNKGLGRGLDALLGNDEDELIKSNENLQMISIDNLVSGKYQPRVHMDKQMLQELAESIKLQGIMQPILVRKAQDSQFEIIAGERRWQAARIANLTEVPVLIKDVSDASALEMALIENIQREDLNVIEEAIGIRRLIEEFGMTHESAADALGKSRAAVSNLLRLLTLSEHVQQALLNKQIEMGHARALVSLVPSDQVMMCHKIINLQLSVREVEKLVAAERVTSPATSRKKTADIIVLENELSEKLGVAVNISHKNNGKGTLKISYINLEQLDEILNKLK